MQPLPIIEASDVGKYIRFCFFMGPEILKMDVFTLQGAEETLNWGIVITISFLAHSNYNVKSSQ
jgi:hypothetical protein